LAGLAKLPVDLVFGLVRDLLTGTLVGKAKELWDVASRLNPGALVGAAGTLLGLALKDVAAKWNDPDVIKRWNFQGFVVARRWRSGARVYPKIVRRGLRRRSHGTPRTLRCQTGARSGVAADHTRPPSASVCQATAVAGPFQARFGHMSLFWGTPVAHVLHRTVR